MLRTLLLTIFLFISALTPSAEINTDSFYKKYQSSYTFFLLVNQTNEQGQVLEGKKNLGGPLPYLLNHEITLFLTNELVQARYLFVESLKEQNSFFLFSGLSPPYFFLFS